MAFLALLSTDIFGTWRDRAIRATDSVSARQNPSETTIEIWGSQKESKFVNLCYVSAKDKIVFAAFSRIHTCQYENDAAKITTRKNMSSICRKLLSVDSVEYDLVLVFIINIYLKNINWIIIEKSCILSFLLNVYFSVIPADNFVVNMCYYGHEFE